MRRLADKAEVIAAVVVVLSLIGAIAMAIGYKTPAQVQSLLSDHETRIKVLESITQETHDWVKDLHDDRGK